MGMKVLQNCRCRMQGSFGEAYKVQEMCATRMQQTRPVNSDYCLALERNRKVWQEFDAA